MHFSKEIGQCGMQQFLILPEEQSSSALGAYGTPPVVTILCWAGDTHTRHLFFTSVTMCMISTCICMCIYKYMCTYIRKTAGIFKKQLRSPVCIWDHGPSQYVGFWSLAASPLPAPSSLPPWAVWLWMR